MRNSILCMNMFSLSTMLLVIAFYLFVPSLQSTTSKPTISTTTVITTTSQPTTLITTTSKPTTSTTTLITMTSKPTTSTTTVITTTTSQPIYHNNRECHKGDLKARKCYHGTGYTGYQKYRCISNSQLEATTKYTCNSYYQRLHGFMLASYCWYPCQMEKHGKQNGDIADECKCERPPTHRTDLTSTCQNQFSGKCNWYQNCFKEADGCLYSYTSLNQLIAFDKEFCQSYDHIRLSIAGKRWLDSAKKCLQPKIAPYLSSRRTVSCSDIKTNVLQAYQCCFMGKSTCNRTLSICDLSVFDFYITVFEIKYQITNTDYSFQILNWVYEFFQSGMRCTDQTRLGKELARDNLSGPIRMVDLKLKFEPSVSVFLNDNTMSINEVAFDVVASIENQSSWNQLKPDFDWFSYAPDSMNSSDKKIKHIQLFIIHRSFSFFQQKFTKLDKVVNNLLNDLKLGYIWIKKTKPNRATVNLKEATLCLTHLCNKNLTSVTPPLLKAIRPTTTTTKTSTPNQKLRGNSEISLKVPVNTIAIALLTLVLLFKYM